MLFIGKKIQYFNLYENIFQLRHNKKIVINELI